MEREELKKFTEEMQKIGGKASEAAKELEKEFLNTSDEPLTEDEISRIDATLDKHFKGIANKNKPKVGGKKITRNEKCPCGSGIKFKKCCMNYLDKN